MSLKRTVEPTLEPVTLAETQLALRLDLAGSPPSNPQDAYVAGCLLAARQWVEDFLERSLCAQTWVMKLDSFPGYVYSDALPRIVFAGEEAFIYLRRPPVLSVTSIEYVDTQGVTQTLDPTLYNVDVNSELARISPAYGTIWPPTRPQMDALIVTYVAGYASTAASPPSAEGVPDGIKTAIKLLVGDLYENREAQQITDLKPNAAVINLLAPHQVRSFF
jgi:uncharacterized phiE125 gp8 family phage protein